MTPTRHTRAVARRDIHAARIVAAARCVLTSGDGLGSLDAIARDAGVGIATLYRHVSRRETSSSMSTCRSSSFGGSAPG